MNIVHISDTHGEFPFLPHGKQTIVHTGDLLPNFQQTRPNALEEMKFQAEWVEDNIEIFKKWIGDRPFVFNAGNHDFWNPQEFIAFLCANGINAYNITEQMQKLDGMTFYGFPWVPHDCQPWNYAIDVQLMQTKMSALKDIIECYNVDILATHCPPANIFDAFYGRHFGNTSLYNMLNGGLQPNLKALLSGHIHNDHGITYKWDMLISQAARTLHRIKL